MAAWGGMHCAHAVAVASLEQALAVDVSIWLIQFIRVMRDEEGKMVKNAHLIGTLRRILKVGGFWRGDRCRWIAVGNDGG